MGHLAKVVTVSDSVAAGTAADRAGPVVAETLAAAGFDVVDRSVVADGDDAVEAALRRATAGFAGLVVTVGGTGFAPRDRTPEATARLLERAAPGLAEAMRASSPRGRLGRGTAGTVGAALICNLPGSPAGATESLGAVVDVLFHALDLLAGEDPHPHPDPA